MAIKYFCDLCEKEVPPVGMKTIRSYDRPDKFASGTWSVCIPCADTVLAPLRRKVTA